MSSCPQCQKPVDAQALSCPYCDNPLKAFGHPGMPLYHSADGTSLCDRCTYHLDNTCNFPQCPVAKSCTLFHDAALPLVRESIKISASQLSWRGIKNWLYRYRGIIAIAILIVISVILVLSSS